MFDMVAHVHHRPATVLYRAFKHLSQVSDGVRPSQKSPTWASTRFPALGYEAFVKCLTQVHACFWNASRIATHIWRLDQPLRVVAAE